MIEAHEFFVVGGTLRADSPSYVTRAADDELFSSLLAGEFCYVLTPRQMGKSSLMVRTAHRLRAQDVRVVRIDLTSIGTVTSDEWYLGLLSRIRSELRLTVDVQAWWQAQALSPPQNFLAFLREMVLAEHPKPIVIFIDEIDSTLNLDFRDDFFAAIRAIYNGRANEPRYSRLTFAFLGVATPTELIRDRKRTPFNIGRRINLQEFNYQEARPLLDRLEALFPSYAAAILHRVFHWTNGHPYLTQKLCLEIASQATTNWDDHAVDRLVEQTLLSDDGRKDTNLVFIQDRILSGSAQERRVMLRLYRQVYDGNSIADDDRSIIQNRLELYGLIKVRENKLAVRNDIYRHVFNADWISTLSQNVPQPRFAIFTDWVGALTIAQRWLAIASVIIALLAIVWVAVQIGRSDAPPNQTAGRPIIENGPIPQEEEEVPADNVKALQEVTQPAERAIVTSTIESVQSSQASATQYMQADYDQALQEVIKPKIAEHYAGYNAKPGVSDRTNITEPLPSLGQSLFFDPILSGDRHISCATCHHPRYAMADGRVLPVGTGGEGLGPQRNFAPTLAIPETPITITNPFTAFIPRNSPSLINVALYPVHMWDGQIQGAYGTDVAQQSTADLIKDMPFLVPLFIPNNMAGRTLGGQEPVAIVNTLLDRLQNTPAYVERFQQAFETNDVGADLITLQRLSAALFAFEQSLIFVEAPWDDYINGQTDALTEQQKRGALLFFGKTKPAVNCAECHGKDQFSDFKTHNLLVPQLGPGAGAGASGQEDWGRGGETDEETDRCAFRTPSLRNVALTAPYFHDGAFATLAAVIRHHKNVEQSADLYDPSANQIPPALPVQPLSEDCRQAWRMSKMPPMVALTDADIEDLVQFLHSLTDPAATTLVYLIPASVPSGLALEPQPGTRPAVIPTSTPTGLPLAQPLSSPALEQFQHLLAPEDEYGKGALFGADEQQAIALEHLGLLQKALDANDWAEAGRHTEHVINILVGKGDENYKDHNVDERVECPGDKVGVGNYLRQVQEQTESLLADLDNRPESNELRLQIELITALSQEARTLITGTVNLALPLFDVGRVAKAKPLAQELKGQLDALTTAIDAVVAKVKPLLDSTMSLTDSKPALLGAHFAAPQEGARVTSPLAVVMAPGGLIVEPAGAIHDGAGHFHILIDTDFVAPDAPIPHDGTHLHFGHGETTTTLPLTLGVHTLRLQFADGGHFALDGEQYQDTIAVTVITDGADLIHVPTGKFTMGSDADQYLLDLNDFWIMRTEVTYQQYAECIVAQKCTEPHNDDRWRDPAYANYPVTNIDWQQANAYAAWVGGRLPTEAEWEKTCRGQEARLYPWGNDAPNAQLANYKNTVGDTKPVGSYPDGASPYGVLDMSGNVWEWTSSLDASLPYQPDDGREDPKAAGKRILRGGSFYYDQRVLTCAFRFPVAPNSPNNQTGLRVVFDQPVR